MNITFDRSAAKFVLGALMLDNPKCNYCRVPLTEHNYAGSQQKIGHICTRPKCVEKFAKDIIHVEREKEIDAKLTDAVLGKPENDIWLSDHRRLDWLEDYPDKALEIMKKELAGHNSLIGGHYLRERIDEAMCNKKNVSTIHPDMQNKIESKLVFVMRVISGGVIGLAVGVGMVILIERLMSKLL